MQIRIWTFKYTPFMMGGSVWQPFATEAEPSETHQVGEYTLHLFRNPISKEYHVADGASGALVGSGENGHLALALVAADIGQGDPDVMAQQVRDAKTKGARARLVPAEEFWRCLANA